MTLPEKLTAQGTLTEKTPLERLFGEIDRAIAASIDSRFPGLSKDIAEAVAERLQEEG
jgi:hypothetical protein